MGPLGGGAGTDLPVRLVVNAAIPGFLAVEATIYGWFTRTLPVLMVSGGRIL